MPVLCVACVERATESRDQMSAIVAHIHQLYVLLTIGAWHFERLTVRVLLCEKKNLFAC